MKCFQLHFRIGFLNIDYHSQQNSSGLADGNTSDYDLNSPEMEFSPTNFSEVSFENLKNPPDRITTDTIPDIVDPDNSETATESSIQVPHYSSDRSSVRI